MEFRGQILHFLFFPLGHPPFPGRKLLPSDRSKVSSNLSLSTGRPECKCNSKLYFLSSSPSLTTIFKREKYIHPAHPSLHHVMRKIRDNHSYYPCHTASPHFSPERETRARRCPKILGFDESSPRPELGTKAVERRERDKARRRTIQYVEPFVRAERRRFGPAPHSLGEVG